MILVSHVHLKLVGLTFQRIVKRSHNIDISHVIRFRERLKGKDVTRRKMTDQQT
jgi:hypothetical protein